MATIYEAFASKQQSPISYTEEESLLSSLGGGAWQTGKGLVSSLFWLLSRPFHGVMGGIYGGLEKGAVGALKGLYGGLTEGAFGIGEKYQDIWAGDILEKLGVEEGGVLLETPFGDINTRDLLAAPLNIALDPIMYLGLGELSVAGKTAATTGKEVPLVTRLLAKGGEKIETLAPTIAKQFAKGQRMALSVGVPFVTKQYKEIPLLSKAFKPLMIGLAKGGRKFREIPLVERYFGRTIEPLFRTLKTKKEFTEMEQLKQWVPVIENIEKSIKDIAIRTGRNIDEIKGKVLEFAEKPTLEGVEKYGEGFGNLIKTIKQVNAEFLKLEQAAGVRVSQLDDLYDYMMRAATPEFKEVMMAMGKKGAGLSVENIPKFVNQLTRKEEYRNLPMHLFNLLLKTKYQSQLKGADAFILDPVLIMAARAGNSARVISKAKFIDDVTRMYGIPIKESGIRAGDKIIADEFKHLGERWWRLPEQFGVSDYLFPQKIAEAVMETYPIYDKALNPIAAIAEKYNKFFFKPWVTILFPAYGIRNFLDDSVRMAIGGLHPLRKEFWKTHKEASALIAINALKKTELNPFVQGKAAQITESILKEIPKKAEEKFYKTLRGVGGIKGKEREIREFLTSEIAPGSGITYGKVLKEANQYGIVSGGFFDSEIWRTAMEDLSRATSGRIKQLIERGAISENGFVRGLAKASDMFLGVFDLRRNWWAKGLKKINSTREDISRLAMYIFKRRQGTSAIESQQFVAKYMYDYLNLGPAEKRFMRHIIPFYSFSRQNIPFWVSQVAQHPQIFSLAEKILPGTEQEIGIPGFIREGIPLQLTKNKDGKTSFLYSLGLSIEDLNRIVTTLAPTPRGVKFKSWMPIDFTRSFQKFFLSSLTPLYKVALERAANKDFFFNSEIGSYAKAYGVLSLAPDFIKDFLGFKEKFSKRNNVIYYRMDPRALHLLRNAPIARIYTTLGKMWDGERSLFQKFLDVTIGARTAVVDVEREKRKFVRYAIKSYLDELELQGAPVSKLSLLYIPKERREEAPPLLKRLVELSRKRVERFK